MLPHVVGTLCDDTNARSRSYPALPNGAGVDSKAASSAGMHTSCSKWARLVCVRHEHAASLFCPTLCTVLTRADSNMARDSFKTFIPISVENGARQRIIFDFFDLMAALAAHGKANGFGGRKLSRMAAWWAFERKDNDNNGFEGGYNAWLK